MQVILRPWQQNAIEFVFKLPEGSRVCIQAPTGAGKNILLQEIAKYYIELGKRVLLVVDRIELVNDLRHEAANMQLQYDIYTTQKVGRRKSAKGYDVYLIDEAHSKYPSVIKSILAQEKSILIGVTATALAKGMGLIYGSHAYVPVTFQELVDDGTLIPPTFIVNKNLIDTSKLKTTAMGEYDLGSLVLEHTILDNINEMIDTYLHLGEQCLILAPNQIEAQRIKENLNRASAIYISNSKEYFEEFKQNYIDVIITVYALSKGFNHPNIYVVIDCRPLKKSLSEFIQGNRSTRRSPGKEKAYYIDMCGNYFRFEKGYNRWRINKRVRLNKKSRSCINCDYNFLKTNIPPKCPEGEHLTYDEMICVNQKCFVDFISEDMLQCPNCNTDLATTCLKCQKNVNICNRICPYCFSPDFKKRPVADNKGRQIDYKAGLLEEFRAMSIDFTEIEKLEEIPLSWSILKTAYYHAASKGKNIMRSAPMYAYTLIQSCLPIFPWWEMKTLPHIYKSFHKNYNEISTGEYNYHLLEKLKTELSKWWKRKGK